MSTSCAPVGAWRPGKRCWPKDVLFCALYCFVHLKLVKVKGLQLVTRYAVFLFCNKSSFTRREGDELARMPSLRTYFRTRSAIVLHLTNGTLQVTTYTAKLPNINVLHIKLSLLQLFFNTLTFSQTSVKLDLEKRFLASLMVKKFMTLGKIKTLKKSFILETILTLAKILALGKIFRQKKITTTPTKKIQH